MSFRRAALTLTRLLDEIALRLGYFSRGQPLANHLSGKRLKSLGVVDSPEDPRRRYKGDIVPRRSGDVVGNGSLLPRGVRTAVFALCPICICLVAVNP